MQVEWYGQSSFRLTDGSTTVFMDPFADIKPLLDRGMRWDYPAIAGVTADLLLVTHEHLDHNGVEAVGGEPVTLRSTAGRLESPIGEVLGIASEHDEVAGTERGANTMFAFTLAGRRVAHLGDLGQRVLRENSWLRSAPSTCSSSRWAGDQRSAPSRPQRSAPPWPRASSCRCTTRPAASTSSNRSTSSPGVRPASRDCPRQRSTSRRCRPATPRSSSCPRRPERTDRRCRASRAQDKSGRLTRPIHTAARARRASRDGASPPRLQLGESERTI